MLYLNATSTVVCASNPVAAVQIRSEWMFADECSAYYPGYEASIIDFLGLLESFSSGS